MLLTVVCALAGPGVARAQEVGGEASVEFVEPALSLLGLAEARAPLPVQRAAWQQALLGAGITDAFAAQVMRNTIDGVGL
ncbi:MAG: hypothetical protein Q7T55_07935, partial [Solirubrobacteraceae bacterium]|nr:hypothetical protein [Solirubrobacteraceae bacterium]